MTDERRRIELVFGPGSRSATEAARASDRRYVRGLDVLAAENPCAKGRRLTALETLQAYGLDKMVEVALEGSAILAEDGTAAGRALRMRREDLGLRRRAVALAARVDEAVVERAEDSRKLPIREYERIARVLGLDERYISVRAEPEGNEKIAVRLRTIGASRPTMGATVVATLAEAAWVGMTQVRLENELGLLPAPTGIQHNANYGTPDFPAYEWGYLLADDARKRLGLGLGPISSLRELAEERLGIPVIQAELGEHIAGVTLEAGSRRAVVVNLSGRNRNVYVRRATIAHELGHLLYDPARHLNALRVDEYEELARRPDDLSDLVERRANAFAVQFLAPQEEAVRTYQQAQEDGVGAVMHQFGLSFTAARYQIWNGLRRSVNLTELTAVQRPPAQRFHACETFANDWHPLGDDLRATRAGRFGAVVVRAAGEGLISWDTAAAWLEVPEATVRSQGPKLRDLYPSVFPT